MTVLLEGNIALISLFNLLQFVRLEQKTCAMEINIKEINQQSRMFFRMGNLMYAEVNMLRGPEAMYRIICWWNNGHFQLREILDVEELPEPNIEEPLESVLLESARYMDECAQFRATLTSLKSALSFSSSAIQAIEQGELPEFTRHLPRSFSVSRYFEVAPYSHWEACEFLKEMLKAGGLTTASEEEASSTQLTAIDSLTTILMEFVGIEESRQIIHEILTELSYDPLQAFGFSQLLNMADRIVEKIENYETDEEKIQEATYRLRARITSLV